MGKRRGKSKKTNMSKSCLYISVMHVFGDCKDMFEVYKLHIGDVCNKRKGKNSSSKGKIELISAKEEWPLVMDRSCEMVALGSHIYALGGSGNRRDEPFKRVRDVFFLDPNDKIEKWKKAPSMMRTRLYPPPLSLPDGKIYVFNPKEGYGPDFLQADVFDSANNGGWSILDLPPPPLTGVEKKFMPVKSAVPDPRRGRLLVYFRVARGLYCYYPSDSKWECLNPNAPNVEFERAAVVGDVLYVCNWQGAREFRASIYVYDLANHRELYIEYDDDEDSAFNQVFQNIVNFVLDLGNGDMCLLIVEPILNLDNIDENSEFMLYCIKFKPVRLNNNVVFFTRPSLYTFRFAGTTVCNCFTLQPAGRREKSPSPSH